LQIADLKLQIVCIMTPQQLRQRTKALALRVLNIIRALPNSIAGRAIANQVVRSGTSVAANYRAACRARSKTEFVAKIGLVLEEADETQLWLELIVESELLPARRVQPLLIEASELVAIFVSTRKSASANLKFTI
jgi:four helix bundle protein